MYSAVVRSDQAINSAKMTDDTLPPQRCEALLQVKVLSKLRTPLILTPWQMTSLTEVQQLLGKP